MSKNGHLSFLHGSGPRKTPSGQNQRGDRGLLLDLAQRPGPLARARASRGRYLRIASPKPAPRAVFNAALASAVEPKGPA